MNEVKHRKLKRLVLGISLAAFALLTGCTILGVCTTPTTRVAVYLDKGARNCGAFCHLRIATLAENVDGFPVDAEMIRRGALNNADVLVMPGGSSITEAKTLGEEGCKKVAEFIRKGGGYIGTCAGCFLVSEKTKSHPNMMGIIPYQSNICRGEADVRIKFNDDAKELTGIPAGGHRVDYHGGPVLEPGKPVEGADFKVIATYDSSFQTSSPKKKPSMVGKAAVVVGTYGKGRIFASAVHPEKDADDHYILEGAFRYVTNGRVTKWQLPRRQRGQLSVGLVCGGSLGVKSAKFLQQLLREGEFDLTSINAEFINIHSLKDFDALLIPDAIEKNKTFQSGTHCAEMLKKFLARGGRVFTWGKAAENCFEFGVKAYEDAKSTIAAMREFAAEPLPKFGDVRAKKIANPVRAAIYTDIGGANTIVAEALEFSPEYEIEVLSAEQIRQGALKNCDLYIQPGGGCHTQYTNLNEKGVAAVTNFVYGGGSYYGICAGAYLASQATNPKKMPRAGFVPYKHDQAPYRGWAPVKMKITEEGLKVFGNAYTNRYVMYWGGPVLVPGDPVLDTDIKVLGEYVGNELSLCSTKATLPMNGKASFLGGRVGKGKAFISAPHPEKQSQTFDMVCSALNFLSGKTPHPVERYRVRGALRVGFDPSTNGEATKFFIKRLAHNSRFDTKTKAWMEDPNLVLHLDAMVLSKPNGKPLTGAYDEFAKAGRPVFVVALNAKERELAAKMEGVTTLDSYEEVMPALEKLMLDETPTTRVAVYLDKGARNCGAFCHLRIATLAEKVEGFPVDAEMIRAGALDGADVLVMPGGSSTDEGKRLGKKGQEKIAEFIRNGGGYIGTCAGCFLVSEKTKSHPERLGIMPYRSEPVRGGADVRIKFNEDAKNLTGIPAGRHRVDYHGGPIMIPGEPVEDGDFKVIATYDSSFQTSSPEKMPSMVGKAAVVVGTYGKGRIFASAVHPEKDADDHYILEGAFRYVTNGRVTKWQLPRRQRGQLSVGLVCGGSLGVKSAKFLQQLLREGEFDLTSINAEFISIHSLKDFDALLIPDAIEKNNTFKSGTHCAEMLKKFLARGGRVFTWGKAAESCFKFGVKAYPDAASTVAAMRAFAAEPLPKFGEIQVKKVANPVRAAIYTDVGGANTIVTEALEFSPEFEIEVISAEEIRQGALKNYDLYIQPGGSSFSQYTNLTVTGIAAVTNFVFGGGSYYGICAGAYVASQATGHKKIPRAGFIPYKHDTAPYRGWAPTKMKITEDGFKVFGNAYTNRYVMYWGGPVLVPGDPVPDTDIKVLGEYVGNELSLCSSKESLPMNGKASILGGRVGKGKAFVTAPHPEKRSSTFDMVTAGIKYLTGQTPHPVERYRVRGALRVGFDPGTNSAATKFFAKRLAHDSRFDTKIKSWMEDPNLVLHIDAVILGKPSKEPLEKEIVAFIKSGRPVFVVASNAKECELAAKMEGVTVLDSYDEVIPSLEKLLK